MITKRLICIFTLLIAAFSTVGLAAQDLPHHISALDWSPNGTMIAVGMGTDPDLPCSGNYAVQLVSPDSGTLIHTLEEYCNVNGLDFSLNNEKLLVVTRTGKYTIWDTAAYHRVFRGVSDQRTLETKWNPIESTFFDLLDHFLCIEDEQGKGITCATTFDDNLHTQGFSSADWSPDGDSVVTSSIDGSIRIWNVTTKQGDSVFYHEVSVNSVAWNHTTNVIASGDAGGVIHI